MNLLLADLHKFVGYSGGIEHVLSRMAFAMKEKGYHVSVVMADEKEGSSFYPFPEDCHFYNLFHMAGLKPVRMSSLGKGLREITRLFSKAGARERNYRMLSAAAGEGAGAGEAGCNHFIPGAHWPSAAGGAGHEGAGDFHAS